MMVPEVELWSPEQELRLLEELAETEAKSFDLDLGLPAPVVATEAGAAVGCILAAAPQRFPGQVARRRALGSRTIDPT